MACPQGLPRPHAFEHRVGADAVRQLLDSRHSLVAPRGDHVGRAVLAGESLPRFVPTHRDDALGTHLPRGEHAEQTDGAVTNNNNGCPGFTFAASAAKHPEPRTSETTSRLGMSDPSGTSGVASSEPSTFGTRSNGSCARVMNSRFTHDD